MDAINTTLVIAQVINVAYWVIDSPETQSMISEINSQSFEATNQDGMIIDGIPVYENIPWADSFPSYENPSSSINTDPGISVFPDTKPLIPSTESFPVETPKSLEDSILWAKIIPNTGTWVPVGETEAEWLANNGYRLGANTIRPKIGEHRKSFPVIDSNGNTVGRVDRGYRVNGKVVVDHVHLNTDVGNVHHWFLDK